eukprot:TRINITY_DN773_c2_g4_i1.p1 TRINITY_DN773_c2_g4~~TRINITY_DN773_c2_g4_i1.p1  ORF type:complete len:104 (-),score=60.73 TRINITY_DN773_c2_g4_i1:132-443(-)
MSFRRLIPLADRVLVQRVRAEAKSASGIFLPESAQKLRLPHGRVIAIGPGSRTREGTLIPTTLKVGNIVALSEYGGTAVKLGPTETDEYHLYHESEILGLLEE